MIKLVADRLDRVAEVAEVHHPAAVGADLAADVNVDTVGVAVQPRALVALRHVRQPVGGLEASLRAIDPKTGQLRWVHKYAGTECNPPRPEHLGGLLSTAGRLLFAGAPGGFLVAYNPETGRQLGTRPSIET